MTVDFKQVGDLAEFLDLFYRDYDSFRAHVNALSDSLKETDGTVSERDEVFVLAATFDKHRKKSSEYNLFSTPAVKTAKANFETSERTLCEIVKEVYHSLEDDFSQLVQETHEDKRPFREIETDAIKLAAYYGRLSAAAEGLPIVKPDVLDKYYHFTEQLKIVNGMIDKAVKTIPPMANKTSFKEYAYTLKRDMRVFLKELPFVCCCDIFTKNSDLERYKEFKRELRFVGKNFDEVSDYLAHLQDATEFMRCFSNTQPFKIPRIDSVQELNGLWVSKNILSGYQAEYARIENLPVEQQHYHETQRIALLRSIAELTEALQAVTKYTPTLDKVLYSSVLDVAGVLEIMEATSGYRDYQVEGSHVSRRIMKKRSVGQTMYMQELRMAYPLFNNFFGLLHDVSVKINDSLAEDFIAETEKHKGNIAVAAQKYKHWVEAAQQYVKVKPCRGIMNFAACVDEITQMDRLYTAVVNDYVHSGLKPICLNSLQERIADHIATVQDVTSGYKRRHPFFAGFSRFVYDKHAVNMLSEWMQLSKEIYDVLKNQGAYKQKSDELIEATEKMRVTASDVATDTAAVETPTKPYLEELLAVKVSASVPAPEVPQTIYFMSLKSDYIAAASEANKTVDRLLDFARERLLLELDGIVKSLTDSSSQNVLWFKEKRSALDSIDRKLSLIGYSGANNRINHYKDYLAQKLRSYPHTTATAGMAAA